MSDETKNAILNPTRRQALTMMAMAGASGLIMPNLLSRDRAFAAAPPAKPTGQMIVGFSQEPTVFNPHMPHIEVDEGIHFSLFDPLFAISPEGKFTPALALDVPSVENGGISADGLSWKVKLREDVKWHDGTPFTAEDVKFTLELLVDPDFRSWRKTGHELVRELTVVSPTEITWKMEKPFAPYPSILASTFIVPKHALGAEKDKNTAPFNAAPIGTGPFKWVERVAGDHITLEANAEYFGDGPYLERVIYKYIPDLTVLYTQFKTGDIDVVGLQWITPDHYEEAKALEGKAVLVVPGSTVESVTFNMEKPQFKDLAVRQALYHALDKATIIDALYYGLPTPTESYMPQQSFYANPDLPKHEYDPEKAKKILDDAGWVAGQRRYSRQGWRQALLLQLDDGRQPYPRTGAAVHAAVVQGYRCRNDHFQPAPCSHVGRILDDVAVRFRRRRHRLFDRRRSRYIRLFQIDIDQRQGRRRTEYMAVFESRGRQTPYRRRPDLRARGAQEDLSQDSGDHARRSAASCRSSNTRRCEATRPVPNSVVPNVNTRIDSWNVGSWYWASKPPAFEQPSPVSGEGPTKRLDVPDLMSNSNRRDCDDCAIFSAVYGKA